MEFALLSSRLHLYAQNVVRSSSMSDSSLGPESAITMHTAFDLAIHIIDIFSSNDLVFGTTDISNSSTSSTSHTHSMLQITLPKHIFRTAVFAAFFLLKYYCSNHHQSSATTSGTTTATTITKQQKEIAKNHVSLLYTELLACSQDPLDEFARTAAVVEVLSRRNTSNSVLSSVSGTQKGNGESRDTNAASIIAEAIDEAGELRGRNRLGDGQNQSTDDANLQWLPPQSEELLDVGMDDAWNAFYGIDWGFNPLIESA